MGDLKKKLIDRFFDGIIILAVAGSAYFIYRVELLNGCVEAKNISGKLYSETEECNYLFKQLEQE